MQVLLRYKLGQDVYERNKVIKLNTVKFTVRKGNTVPHSEWYNDHSSNGGILKFNYENHDDHKLLGDDTVITYGVEQHYNSYDECVKALTGDCFTNDRVPFDIDNKFELGTTVYYFGRGNRLRESIVEAISYNSDGHYKISYTLKSVNKEYEKDYPSINQTWVKDYHTEDVTEHKIYYSKEEFIRKMGVSF